ncbi:hypothetical protein MnTg02_01667 [bacterium MnTg02]|nr:hypothetical protein MnTg02_01667 [bacterium MnTg02]
MNAGAVRPGRSKRGTWGWVYEDDSEPFAKISYYSDLTDREYARLELSFQVSGEPVKQTIDLISTRPNFGGARWWFKCPCIGKMCAKLYLPPGKKVFGCRDAYGLTYQSCRDSGKYRTISKLLAASTGMSPDEIERLLRW